MSFTGVFAFADVFLRCRGLTGAFGTFGMGRVGLDGNLACSGDDDTVETVSFRFPARRNLRVTAAAAGEP